MAEPKPASPGLAAVPDSPSPDPEAEGPALAADAGRPQRKGAPWWLFALAVALLAVSLWGLVAQTLHAREQGRQLAALGEEVTGLESELATVHEQLTHFGMQRELVVISAEKLAKEITSLQGLVGWDPSEPGDLPAAVEEAEPGAVEAPASGPSEATAEPDASGNDTAPGGEGAEPGDLELAPRDI